MRQQGGGAMSWTCPFCQREHATVESDDSSVRLAAGSKYGSARLQVYSTACAADGCKEISLSVALIEGEYRGNTLVYGTTYKKWMLMPAGIAKPFSPAVPAVLLMDYNEACSIASLSPKASATLARRCQIG